jgi:hypothetical protein
LYLKVSAQRSGTTCLAICVGQLHHLSSHDRAIGDGQSDSLRLVIYRRDRCALNRRLPTDTTLIDHGAAPNHSVAVDGDLNRGANTDILRVDSRHLASDTRSQVERQVLHSSPSGI